MVRCAVGLQQRSLSEAWFSHDLGCGSAAEPQAERACGKAVLTDWADGAIDETYPGPCYLAAIEEPTGGRARLHEREGRHLA